MSEPTTHKRRYAGRLRPLLGLVLALAACARVEHIGPEPLRQTVGQSTPEYEATIEQFYQAADGGDWSPAFQRFMASSSARLRLSCFKTYSVSSTIDVCRPVVIEGCGPTTGGSEISAASGVTAIAVRADAFCPGTGVSGAGSRFSDLSVEDHTYPTTKVHRFGILMEAPAHVERVTTSGFSNGIRVDADLARSGSAKSDAEAWSVNDVIVNFSDHAGLIAIGDNASNGLLGSLSVVHTCWDPDKLTAGGVPLYPSEGTTPPVFPQCAAFIDGSKWGNTYYAAHAADTKDREPKTGSTFTTTYYQPARFIGISRAVCVGCYREAQATGVAGYSDVAVLNTTSIGLGGKMAYGGGGVAVWSAGTPGLRFDNLSLMAPTFEPATTTGTTYPILMRLHLQSGNFMHIEQDNAPAFSCAPNCKNLRGSWKGANAFVAWRWKGDPAEWQP